MNVWSIFSMKIYPKVTFSHFLGCHTIFEHDPHGTKTILIIPKKRQQNHHQPNHEGAQNTKTNSSTSQAVQTCLTNSQTVTHERWLVRYSLHTPGFSCEQSAHYSTNVLPSWLIAHYNILHMLNFLQCSHISI